MHLTSLLANGCYYSSALFEMRVATWNFTLTSHRTGQRMLSSAALLQRSMDFQVFSGVYKKGSISPDFSL